MRQLENIELMPEPDDSRILTAVDFDAPGYSGKEYGLDDIQAKKLRFVPSPIMKFLWPYGAIVFTFGVVFILFTWNLISPIISEVLPETEWAYEDSGIRELQEIGYYGSGVNVCIVDTGFDRSHQDFNNVRLEGFRDFFYNNNDEVRDIGKDSHGTLMAGLLVANGSYIGAAPEVSLSVAIALGPGGKSTDEGLVSQAIRWCRISQDADIISLSLGSNPNSEFAVESKTVIAVNEALNSGIFVIAAAGNTDNPGENTDVSTPASIEGVIAVGAHNRDGIVWSESAPGSEIDPYTGDNRTFPNQKPEISAPGVYIFSTLSNINDIPYAYSTGTSDSTVLVTGALALILQIHGDSIRGEDNFIDRTEINLVKVALANSATNNYVNGISHDSKSGYGLLNANEWANQVDIEFN
jgi:serine protease AprX